MAYEQKPGQFTLFKNDKDGNESRPDYTGTGLDLDGNQIKVAAWLKQGKNGKFMACNIQRKDGQQAPKKKEPPPIEDDPAFADDSIPF